MTSLSETPNGQATAPSLSEVLADMGLAGLRLDELHATESGAGNMSVALRETPDLTGFGNAEPYELPVAVPALAGWTVVVTGSGTRLRDVAEHPDRCLAVVVIGDDGVDATLHSAPARTYVRPTSEFNSHLGVHAEQVAARPELSHHAIVHAQPPYLVALSHIPRLADTLTFSRAITRWEPETIIQLPDGIGVIPYAAPGSDTLMAANVEQLCDRQIVLWCKHGVMVRSDDGALAAVDKIEYAETGAMYEHWNMTSGGEGEGLTLDQIRGLIDAFGLVTTLY